MSQRNAPVSLNVPTIDRDEHIAIKSMFQGEATPDQQVLFLSVVLKKLSRAYDLTYIPGSFDESAFLAGRGFVGQQLIKLNNQKVSDA